MNTLQLSAKLQLFSQHKNSSLARHLVLLKLISVQGQASLVSVLNQGLSLAQGPHDYFSPKSGIPPHLPLSQPAPSGIQNHQVSHLRGAAYLDTAYESLLLCVQPLDLHSPSCFSWEVLLFLLAGPNYWNASTRPSTAGS